MFAIQEASYELRVMSYKSLSQSEVGQYSRLTNHVGDSGYRTLNGASQRKPNM